jgi:hypothetical protein
MKKQKRNGDNKGGKQEENQRAGSDVHASIETLREEGVEVGKEGRRGFGGR